jgi:hypothetical protein
MDQPVTGIARASAFVVLCAVALWSAHSPPLAQTPRVSFSLPVATDLSVTNLAGSVTGDFNQDGRLDLLVAATDASAANVNLFAGTGAGSLSRASGVVFSEAVAVAAADFNRDGVVDIVLTQDVTSKVGIYGDQVCGSTVGIAIFLGPLLSGRCIATIPRAVAVQAADFDGDDRPDIVVAGAGNQALTTTAGWTSSPPR